MERVKPSDEHTDLSAEGSGESHKGEAPPPRPARGRRMGKKPFYLAKTNGGFQLDEVASALQKSIRRGLEQEAMFWALEMAESGYGQYLWKRLLVISAEDIGPADPAALILTYAAWAATKDSTSSFSKAPGMRLEFLGVVLLHLCRAPKSREGDDFCWYVMERRARGWKIPVPDFALDDHTDRGRKMKRGRQFWFEEASKLENAVEIRENVYATKVRELFATGEQSRLGLPNGEKP